MARTNKNYNMVVAALIMGLVMLATASQQELARKTGMRQSNISRIENGSCSPTVETLSVIAAGLGKKLEIRFV